MSMFIEWKRYSDQDQIHGYLGEERICAVMPWDSENGRWPWQLQLLVNNSTHSEGESALCPLSPTSTKPVSPCFGRRPAAPAGCAASALRVGDPPPV